MSDLLSVLMPFKNEQRFIGEAMLSVFNQTHRDFEVVAVDDGSTDASLEILRSFADPRVRVVKGPGRGLVAALNAGLASCSGRYIARMDADDLSAQTRFAAQLEVLRGDSRIFCVGCDFGVIDGNGGYLHVIRPPQDDVFIRRRMRWRNPFAHGSLMFRRSPELRYSETAAEDYQLLYRLGKHGSLASIPKVLYSWRAHGSGVSATRARDVAESARATRDAVWEDEDYWPELRGAGPDRAEGYETELLLLALSMRRRNWRSAIESLRVLRRADSGDVKEVVGDLRRRLVAREATRAARK